MNLRISNLSHKRNMQIKATNSARLLDGFDLYTDTDSTVSLIPGEDREINGTLYLAPDDMKVTLATDLPTQTVIVKTGEGFETAVPLEKNIVIECNNQSLGVSCY